jgi:UDP-N-acetylglucosamine diphosphorylase/glucosamine-1-phosphate N-acetyltransferase
MCEDLKVLTCKSIKVRSISIIQMEKTGNVIAIIMAGGLGKRMESNTPKVLIELCGVPMIVRILRQLKYLNYSINLEKIIIVVGKYKDQIKDVIDKVNDLPEIVYVTQPESLGTGHAIMCCEEELKKSPDSDVLILSGDVPLLSVNTMKNLLHVHGNIKLITATMNNPSGYGRIVMKDGKFEKIVEHKDCNERELKINQLNGGIYCIKSNLLINNFKHLSNNNNQHEYYLTDLVEIIQREEKMDIGILEIDEERVIEIIGVNTNEQLIKLDELLKNKIETENGYK